MSIKYYLDWKEVDYKWIEKDWNWIDVFILIEETVGEILGGDFHLDVDPLNPWESMEKKMKKQKIAEDKINKILEVIISVNGESKTFKKEIRNNNKKILIEDIQKTLNKYGHSHIKVEAEIKK